MTQNPFPKATPNRFTGISGLNRVSTVVNDDFRWIFRKVEQDQDYGIDAYADVVTEDGLVTGQGFAFQIKYGDSYFANETDVATTYYGEQKHLNFYHNSPVPVILVVGRPGGLLYWVQFNVDETDRTPTGWKLDIPKGNILDAKAKDALLAIVGPPRDAAAVAKEQWELAEMLDSYSRIIYHITADDLRKGRTWHCVSFLRRLISTNKLARRSQGKLELYTSAYDNDVREVWEAPEFRRWLRKIEGSKIPWFFLCNATPPNIWLRVYFPALCGGARHGIQVVNGRMGVRYTIDPKKAGSLLQENFLRLNKVCMERAFSEAEIERISRAAIASFRSGELDPETFQPADPQITEGLPNGGPKAANNDT